jgi:hypothetical protein
MTILSTGKLELNIFFRTEKRYHKLDKFSRFFKPIIVVRLNGGLGNHLFTHAAERRLAYVNNFHLYIDTISVFFRDKFYKRRCRLDSYSIIGKNMF